jgi:hypothetical protein
MNVLNALANLYRSLGHHDQAAHYYAKNIQRQDSEQVRPQPHIRVVCVVSCRVSC